MSPSPEHRVIVKLTGFFGFIILWAYKSLGIKILILTLLYACILPTFQTTKCQTFPSVFIFADLVHNIYIRCSVGTHGILGIGSTLTEPGPSDVGFDFNLI